MNLYAYALSDIRVTSKDKCKPCSTSVSIMLSVWLGLAALCSTQAQAQWTQYGGPGQAFTVSGKGLAETWPPGGPPLLWRRDLGEGYSSILADAGRLYTMYRAGRREHVVCLDAKTGKTLWDHAYNSGPQEGHYAKFGSGPESTPLSTDVNNIYDPATMLTEPDDVASDAEEQNLLFAGISNLITTRSDVFTVYFRIRSFQQNPTTGFWDATDPEFIVDDSRYVMLVDRSEVNTPLDKPKILYLEKIAQ